MHLQKMPTKETGLQISIINGNCAKVCLNRHFINNLKTKKMKKLITLITPIICSMIILSCKKDNMSLSAPAPAGYTLPVVSNWKSMLFQQTSDGVSNFLLASDQFNSPIYFDPADDVQLAFVKISSQSGRTVSSYKALPMTVNTASGNVKFSFSLSYTNFLVKVQNEDQITLPDGNDYSNYQFRYIVVSNSMYHSMNINWNNYAEVATALGIPI
jgi:hypothetical protein